MGEFIGVGGIYRGGGKYIGVGEIYRGRGERAMGLYANRL